MSDDQLASTHVIDAPAANIFAVLADPVRHQDTEPGDWVGNPIDPEPLTQVGQMFGMHMYAQARGAYDMWNRVTVLEPDRAIAWAPGRRDENGEVTPGGHIWRYDLEPSGDGTRVTLTYDWSGMPQQVRERIGMPPFGTDFLDQSLASLERSVV